MKEFNIREGTYIKSNNSTSKIMNNFLIALIPLVIYAFIKNGIYPFIKTNLSFFELIRPLLMIIISILSCILTEYIWFNVIKKKKYDLKYYFTKSYAIIPGVLLALMLPLETPLYLIIIGGIATTILGKLIFGGLGENLFNPSLIGKTFIMILLIVFFKITYSNPIENNILTPLNLLKQNNFVVSLSTINNTYGSLFNMLLGNIPGSLGVTSSGLCLIGFIYLIINKAIKWRITVYYVLTVFIMTMIFGFSNDMGLWYPLVHVLSGGLLFSAVFIATDPITSPITGFGQVVYGIVLGIISVILRFLLPIPEETIIVILFMNLLVPFINSISIRVHNNSVKRLIYYISLIMIIIITPIIINGLK